MLDLALYAVELRKVVRASPVSAWGSLAASENPRRKFPRRYAILFAADPRVYVDHLGARQTAP